MSAEELLDRAIARHGGAAGRAWLERGVRIHVESLGGAIPRRRGLGHTHPKPGDVTAEPFAARMTFHDYPERGADLVYERGTVIRDGERLERYRRRFDGRAKRRTWSPEDAVYFFGYAVTDYLSLPFSIRGLEIVRTGARRYRAQRVDFIDVLHPAGADTHGRKQSYYFAEDGLLVRHDYRADILGRLFTGAHDSGDYDESHPAPVARSRIVRARLGRMVTPIKVLEARFRFEPAT